MEIPLTSTSPSFKDLLTLNTVYLIAFSWLFGQNVWQSFFGGVIAHKSLTRQTFAQLQSRTFPTYFATTSALSTLLLGLYGKANSDQIMGNYLRFGNPIVLQAWTLFGVVSLSLLNMSYIGPVTNKLISTRQRLERAEGKPYYDPGVSPQMKALNSKFGKWHGISALANLIVILALLFHGAWLANFGLDSQKINLE